ncbi:MAG: hypothetical protein EZS28_039594, partial [Streblomastix strix]
MALDLFFEQLDDEKSAAIRSYVNETLRYILERVQQNVAIIEVPLVVQSGNLVYRIGSSKASNEQSGYGMEQSQQENDDKKSNKSGFRSRVNSINDNYEKQSLIMNSPKSIQKFNKKEKSLTEETDNTGDNINLMGLLEGILSWMYDLIEKDKIAHQERIEKHKSLGIQIDVGNQKIGGQQNEGKIGKNSSSPFLVHKTVVDEEEEEEIEQLTSQLSKELIESEKRCKDFREGLMKYTPLWTLKSDEAFSAFLQIKHGEKYEKKNENIEIIKNSHNTLDGLVNITNQYIDIKQQKNVGEGETWDGRSEMTEEEMMLEPTIPVFPDTFVRFANLCNELQSTKDLWNIDHDIFSGDNIEDQQMNKIGNKDIQLKQNSAQKDIKRFVSKSLVNIKQESGIKNDENIGVDQTRSNVQIQKTSMIDIKKQQIEIGSNVQNKEDLQEKNINYEINSLNLKQTLGQVNINQNPPLIEWVRQMETISQINQEISGLDQRAVLGWVCIDTALLKQELFSLSAKWRLPFSQFLIGGIERAVENCLEVVLQIRKQFDSTFLHYTTAQKVKIVNWGRDLLRDVEKMDVFFLKLRVRMAQHEQSASSYF